MRLRDVMTSRVEWVSPDATVEEAAQKMRRMDVGALPVCEHGHLVGMLTDRDIVVRVVAAGMDPSQCRLGDVVTQGEVVTIGADDTLEEAARTMKEHGVLRLPVIDGTDLVGMVSQADIARGLPDARLGDLVGEVKAQPPQS